MGGRRAPSARAEGQELVVTIPGRRTMANDARPLCATLVIGLSILGRARGARLPGTGARHVRVHGRGGRGAIMLAKVASDEVVGTEAEPLLVEVTDELIWASDQLELSAIERSPDTPFALQGYVGSFRRDAVFPENRESLFHAFEAFGEPLESFSGWTAAREKPLADEERLAPIRDLIEAVNFLHCRGLPHLCLNDRSIRIGRLSPGGPPRLRILGVGAGPSLNSANRTFQVPESWAYTAPEVLGGLIVQVMAARAALRGPGALSAQRPRRATCPRSSPWTHGPWAR